MSRRPTIPPAAWMTPDGLELARDLWDEGLSAAAIGTRVGCSKDAVLGYAHRNGWPPRQVAERAPQKPHRSRNAPPTRKSPRRDPDKLRVGCEPQPLGLPTTAFRGCQWIEGTDRKTWRFCEAPVASTGAWCQVHRAMVYIRPPRWDRLAVAA